MCGHRAGGVEFELYEAVFPSYPQPWSRQDAGPLCHHAGGTQNSPIQNPQRLLCLSQTGNENEMFALTKETVHERMNKTVLEHLDENLSY